MSFKGIRAGDLVKYQDRFGHTFQGRAQALLCFDTHVVINIGGLYGTPKVVNDSNYVSHRPPRRLPQHRSPA
jgi:hypothetical protein